MSTEDAIEDVVAGLTKNNPGRRFAASDKNDAVGIWDEEAKRFWTLYAKTIMGTWDRCRTELHIKTNDYDGPAFTYRKATQCAEAK